jgi:hypothetical protein
MKYYFYCLDDKTVYITKYWIRYSSFVYLSNAKYTPNPVICFLSRKIIKLFTPLGVITEYISSPTDKYKKNEFQGINR